MITDLKPGTLYQLKDSVGSRRLLAQVCPGGDCAIFRDLDDLSATLESDPLFRVLVNQRDLKRNWRKVGVFPLAASISDLQLYADWDDFSGQCFAVRLDDIDDRTVISAEAARALEPLAVWDTWNILDRLSGTNFF